MAKAGYCRECGKNVWLREDGNGECGHPASSFSGIYEADRESKKKKATPAWLIVLVVILGICFVSAALVSLRAIQRDTDNATEKTSEEAKESVETLENEEKRAKTPIEEKKPLEPQLIEFSGSDQQVSDEFTLESGLSIFRMTHADQSNFTVWLLDSNEQRIEMLADVVGPFYGSKVLGIDTAGEYIVDISTSGNWTVRIEQPRQTSVESTLRTLSGKGQQASEFIKLDTGSTVFRLRHDGSQYFTVWLLDNKGAKVEMLANEAGSFSSSKTVEIDQPGVYILDIAADGSWTITVE